MLDARLAVLGCDDCDWHGEVYIPPDGCGM